MGYSCTEGMERENGIHVAGYPESFTSCIHSLSLCVLSLSLSTPPSFLFWIFRCTHYGVHLQLLALLSLVSGCSLLQPMLLSYTNVIICKKKRRNENMRGQTFGNNCVLRYPQVVRLKV